MGPEGLEPKTITGESDNELATSPECRAAECGASGPENAPIDPDLALVIERWPDVTPDLRTGIVAMVKGAG
jgi:hypothetical protein